MGAIFSRLSAAVSILSVFVIPSAALAQKGKPIVAIYQMDDVARSGQADTFSRMIETAIASTSKFRVIERERLGKLVGEQARAKAGLVTSNTPGKIGGFEGADFLIYGSITTVSVTRKSDIGANLMSGLLAGGNNNQARCNNAVATVSVDIKITDANTGEIKYVTRIDETQKSAASCGPDAQVDSAVLLRSAAEKVATGLVTTIYPIQIASVQGDGVIVLNYGEGAVQPGAVMGVYTKGEAIVDPATGEVIGNNETRIGFIRVTDVAGRISKALPATEFPYAPAVGSIVRPATTADIQGLSKKKRR